MGFLPFCPPFISINLSLLSGPRRATCPLQFRVRFYPKTINFFSPQFILNELSLSNFLTSEIFVKISSLESLKILTVLEFDETFLTHYISRDESNDTVRFIIRDIENFLNFPKSIHQFYYSCHFSENFKFFWVL